MYNASGKPRLSWQLWGTNSLRRAEEEEEEEGTEGSAQDWGEKGV